MNCKYINVILIDYNILNQKRLKLLNNLYFKSLLGNYDWATMLILKNRKIEIKPTL